MARVAAAAATAVAATTAWCGVARRGVIIYQTCNPTLLSGGMRVPTIEAYTSSTGSAWQCWWDTLHMTSSLSTGSSLCMELTVRAAMATPGRKSGTTHTVHIARRA